MRLLVTGGAGFIGANFVRYWLAAHPQDRVVVLDALTYAGHRDNLAGQEDNPQLRFVEGDINDGDLVIELLSGEALDTIVHFAAESHVDRSVDEPDVFIETNVVGTHTLLRSARKVWLQGEQQPHRFHHVSTDEVYGSLDADDPAFTETTPYAPNSPYAASKAASDHLVRAYGETYGLQTTISNCSNNYGPRQLPEKLIPLFIRRLSAGETVPVYGDGGNVRDWLHVEDHCRGIEAVLDRGAPGRTYNVGGRNERSNLEVVRLLCRLFDQRFPGKIADGHESLIEFVTDRPGHDRRYAIDPRRMETELDFRIKRRFEEGLAATLDWYLANGDWVERHTQPLPAWLQNPDRGTSA
ncbi:MAG: dTDP-glucose 4,6-dehydratase [Gammaproteobacteria bacterium]